MSKSKKTSKQSRKSKPKREKITWVDDGSTVADMSGVSRGLGGNKKNQNPNLAPRPATRNGKAPTRFQECASTYFGAVRMMFVPMLVVIGIICVVFLLLWLGMGAMS